MAAVDVGDLFTGYQRGPPVCWHREVPQSHKIVSAFKALRLHKRGENLQLRVTVTWTAESKSPVFWFPPEAHYFTSVIFMLPSVKRKPWHPAYRFIVRMMRR